MNDWISLGHFCFHNDDSQAEQTFSVAKEFRVAAQESCAKMNIEMIFLVYKHPSFRF